MAREYTKEDLTNNNRFYANRLRTQVLEDFYTENLEQNAYIYTLNNGNTIRLLFDNDQFCHLVGFSYFGYNGISGWNLLKTRNILVSNLQGISKHKREEIRITNFPKIVSILNNPKMYLYRNTTMNYNSDYFAVYDATIIWYLLL